MGGQVLGGGVIVLVAVVLWLVYLLPSWHSRHQYDAAERNAVRLNQALRVLAETSETPEEVHLELNARTALVQQKLARRAQAEREDGARRAQAEREDIARRVQHERARAEVDRERADLERARRERAVARATPEARRARARRRARLLVASVALTAVVLAGAGVWTVVVSGSPLLLLSAVLLAAGCVTLLARMARVGVRAVLRASGEDAVSRSAREVQDVALGLQPGAGWMPRELPRPLTASAGSRAAAILDGVAAREALREAAREEAMLARMSRSRPATIDPARVARRRAAASALSSPADAEIEAQVREMLRRRAAG